MATMGLMQHVGICVSNMEKTLAFYRDILGLKQVASFEASMPEVAKVVEVPNARIKVTMLKSGEGEEETVVELLEYLSPKGKPFPRDKAMNDVGISHVAFWVKDIDQAYEELKKKGVVFNCPPQSIEVRDLGKIKAVYFKDPEGITLELMERC